MPLQLEIISEHAEIVGDDFLREFTDEGGTIGRSLENDWVLPDPDRYISGRHATLDHKGGIWYLADLSTNGVYVNGEHEPVGRGNPRRLFNGDVLRMGDFEFKVAIDQGESIAMPIEGEKTVAPEPMEISVPEASLRSGVQLLDEDELFGNEVFDPSLFSEPEEAVAELAPEPVPIIDEAEELDVVVTDSLPAAREHQAEDLLVSFLQGLGINRSDLHPSVNPADILRHAGEVMREFVAGSCRMLESRASLKTAFNLDQTTMLPRHNNPLKLGSNTNELVMQLLVGEEGDYLGPRDAVREVCQDLLHHQDALLASMGNAFAEFAARFDPEELSTGFDTEVRRLPLLGMLNRSRYWQLYQELYPVLVEKGDSTLPQLLSEDFVSAYEAELADLKRRDTAGIPNSMAATVRRHVTDLVTGDEPVNEEFDPEFIADLEDSIAGKPRRNQA